MIKLIFRFTFLPLSILYQFNNYFNIFFLATAVLLSIPFLSPIEPATAMAPFCFVLLISVIRELVEDLVKINLYKFYLFLKESNLFLLRFILKKEFLK